MINVLIYLKICHVFKCLSGYLDLIMYLYLKGEHVKIAERPATTDNFFVLAQFNACTVHMLKTSKLYQYFITFLNR